MGRVETASIGAVLSRVLDVALSLTMSAARLLGAAIVVVVTASVIARYVFARPSVAMFEFSENALLILVLLAIPYVAQMNEHVRLEVLEPVVGDNTQHRLRIVATLIGFLVALALAVAGAMVARQDFATGVATATILRIPRWTIVVFIPISGSLLTLQQARELWRLWTRSAAEDHDGGLGLQRGL